MSIYYDFPKIPLEIWTILKKKIIFWKFLFFCFILKSSLRWTLFFLIPGRSNDFVSPGEEMRSLLYFVRPFVKRGRCVILTFNFLTGNVHGLIIIYNLLTGKYVCVIARFVHLSEKHNTFNNQLGVMK